MGLPDGCRLYTQGFHWTERLFTWTGPFVTDYTWSEPNTGQMTIAVTHLTLDTDPRTAIGQQSVLSPRLHQLMRLNSGNLGIFNPYKTFKMISNCLNCRIFELNINFLKFWYGPYHMGRGPKWGPPLSSFRPQIVLVSTSSRPSRTRLVLLNQINDKSFISSYPKSGFRIQMSQGGTRERTVPVRLKIWESLQSIFFV